MIDLDTVAKELSWLDPEPVFVGGAVVPLYLDAFGQSQMRPTEDVDCIVPAVTSRKQWWDLEEQLRRRRWSPDQDGPLCRYRSPSGALVDLMPADASILGFSGRWYPRVISQAVRHALGPSSSVLIAPPALLLACKLEAYGDRGSADPWGSKDLEDVAALLDGCKPLQASVERADPNLRSYIARALDDIEASISASEALRGQLPRGGDERRQLERIDRLLAKLRTEAS
jgi:hypothetical protein